jgi:hypothetical protein
MIVPKIGMNSIGFADALFFKAQGVLEQPKINPLSFTCCGDPSIRALPYSGRTEFCENSGEICSS